MKKIFYILTAAVVALGAMACENEGFDNIAPEMKGEGLYLTAKISRTGLDENNMTTWGADDVVTITFGGKTFNFAHQGGGVFFSDTEGVLSLKGQSGLTAWYNEKGIDSTAGTAGARLKAEGGSFDADGVASGFNFAIQNGFVKVEIMNDFKDPFVLTTSEAIFSTGKSVEIKGNKGVHYIAIKPSANPVTLSATIGGVEIKNGTVTFQDKKVNNIGQLNPNLLYLVPSSKWKEASARFAAYFYNDSTGTNTWVNMVDGNDDGIYTVLIPEGTWPNVIFCRMNPENTTNGWGKDNMWTQTGNLTVNDTPNNYYYVYGWNYGYWHDYEYEHNAVAIVNTTEYTDIDKAISAAGTSTAITLLDDVTVSKACRINKGDFSFSVSGDFVALKNYNNNNGYYDVKAYTNDTTWRLAGKFGGKDKWTVSAGAQHLKKITGTTTTFVVPNVTLTTADYFKFAGGTSAWSKWVGSYTGEDGNDSKIYPTLENHTKSNKYGSSNTWNNKKGNFAVSTDGTYDIYMSMDSNGNANIWVEKL